MDYAKIVISISWIHLGSQHKQWRPRYWLRLIHIELFQPRDRAYGCDYSPISKRFTSCLFELDDYLYCVLPDKCFGNIQIVYFYGDYHHSLLKVTHKQQSLRHWLRYIHVNISAQRPCLQQQFICLLLRDLLYVSDIEIIYYVCAILIMIVYEVCTFCDNL